MMMTRTELLNLSEAELVKLCRCEACRGTGPGGQKRNKTSSSIQVTHLETGISAADDQERSQYVNKGRALAKLRMQFALRMREIAVPWEGDIPGVRNPRRVNWYANALDHLATCDYHVAEASACMGLSSGRLQKELAKEPIVWRYVNAERQKRGYGLLRQ